MKLDAEEREILASYERGEWRPVGPFSLHRNQYARCARATFRKDRRLNIRISSKDLEAIQKRALEEGLPYQTLIASLLHKYASGRLRKLNQSRGRLPLMANTDQRNVRALSAKAARESHPCSLWVCVRATDKARWIVDEGVGCLNMSQQTDGDRMETSVFLCHASDDKSAVRSLYRRLCQHGIRVWFDEKNLLPGQNWETEIKKAVRSHRIVIVCLSEKSVKKQGFVNKEIKFALDVADEKPDNTVYIVPARLDDCEVPDRLRKWQWVDLFARRGYNDLLRTLGSASEGSPETARSIKRPWCLALADGSNFAMVQLAKQGGFTNVVSIPAIENFSLTDRDLSDAGLVILVRGEHFQATGKLSFYEELRKYVAGGGFLLATPWVSWETTRREMFDDILPFDHPDRGFTENARLVAMDRTTREKFTFQASYEHLGAVRPGATLLMDSTDGTPILGVRDYVSGCCIYLNICEHSCYERMGSPLSSSKVLAETVRKMLFDIYSEIFIRQNRIIQSGSSTSQQPFIPRSLAKALFFLKYRLRGRYIELYLLQSRPLLHQTRWRRRDGDVHVLHRTQRAERLAELGVIAHHQHRHSVFVNVLASHA